MTAILVETTRKALGRISDVADGPGIKFNYRSVSWACDVRVSVQYPPSVMLVVSRSFAEQFIRSFFKPAICRDRGRLYYRRSPTNMSRRAIQMQDRIYVLCALEQGDRVENESNEKLIGKETNYEKYDDESVNQSINHSIKVFCRWQLLLRRD